MTDASHAGLCCRSGAVSRLALAVACSAMATTGCSWMFVTPPPDLPRGPEETPSRPPDGWTYAPSAEARRAPSGWTYVTPDASTPSGSAPRRTAAWHVAEQECTASGGVPALDMTLAAVLAGIGTLGVLAVADCKGDCLGAAQVLGGSVALIGAGAVFAVSAGYGFSKTSDCTKWREQHPGNAPTVRGHPHR